MEAGSQGYYASGRHFPGAESGGARGTYLAIKASAGGWLAMAGACPCRGARCVVYHEGCGHTVGLPHPELSNHSVMGLAQYQGWLRQAWLDKSQKRRLGWVRPEQAFDDLADLFSMFTALPEPKVPKPGQSVSLKLNWPAKAR